MRRVERALDDDAVPQHFVRRIEGTVHAVSECFLRPELIEELFVHERLHENDERSRPPRAFAHLKVVNHHVVRFVFVERLQAKQVRALRYARHSRLRPGAVGNRTARQIFANAFAQNARLRAIQVAHHQTFHVRVLPNTVGERL